MTFSRTPLHSALAAILLTMLQGPVAPAVDRAEPPSDPMGLRGTQLTIRLGRKQFQATVVAKTASSLTLVTAAHCIAPQEVGSGVVLSQGPSALIGKITSATPNPDYHPISSRDPQNKGVRGVLCVDNAVAQVELSLRNEAESRVFQAVQAAELAAVPVPGGSAPRTVMIHIIDQHGAEHAVKAGNHLNPKCLAWGNASFRPQPGDSGAGVFFIRESAEGKPTAILIGNVALSDDRGGIAPLLSRRNEWVEQALSGQGPSPKQPASSGP